MLEGDDLSLPFVCRLRVGCDDPCATRQMDRNLLRETRWAMAVIDIAHL